CLLQNALADCAEHKSEQAAFEVLAFTDDLHINIGRAVGLTGKSVGMSGCTAPEIGVSGGEHDMVRIGPVVVQTFPHTTGAFGDISLDPALLMDCEIFVRAIGKELRTAWTEIGESGDVLLRCQVGCLMKMDSRHCITPFLLSSVVFSYKTGS